jgi:hypothetical protein
LPLLLQSGPRDESVIQDESKKTQPPKLQQQTSNGSQDQDTASRTSGPPQRSKRKYRRHPKVSSPRHTCSSMLKQCIIRQTNTHRNVHRRHTSSSQIVRVVTGSSRNETTDTKVYRNPRSAQGAGTLLHRDCQTGR